MVEAQTVREVEQEPAANDKPEPWIVRRGGVVDQPGRRSSAPEAPRSPNGLDCAKGIGSTNFLSFLTTGAVGENS